MKPLIFSILFLNFLSCNFLTPNHALQYGGRKFNIEHHFHTIEISSLLPASTCISSTGTKGLNNRQSTLEVTHRHGPCSKLSKGKSTTPSLDEILARDQSRVGQIQARIKPDQNNSDRTTNFKSTLIDTNDVNIPAQSGRALKSGNYVVTVALGTPKSSLHLIFDTGSDLTWTQCEPCVGSCYQQQDPIFNPTLSSTFSNVSCSSPECTQLSSTTGNRPRCTASNTCVYGIQYGDQSFSVGFFSRDTLTITSDDVFPNFYFGCGQDNEGLFGEVAGLIGLGRDPLSLVSQTAQKYGNYFSYCLPSTSSSTGFLTLGKSGSSPSNNLKFTPFSSSQGNQFYFIDITSIYVGGQQLSISESVFTNAGSIIDSGTVITRLPPTAYSTMSTAFKQLMQNYPTAPAFSILDTCFDFGSSTSITIPTVSFVFNGNVKVDLDPSGILVAVNTTRACLAFAGNSGASDVGIFGNTQQKTIEVVYDVDGGKLGFAPGGCN